MYSSSGPVLAPKLGFQFSPPHLASVCLDVSERCRSTRAIDGPGEPNRPAQFGHFGIAEEWWSAISHLPPLFTYVKL